jgi:hypothetical protein
MEFSLRPQVELTQFEPVDGENLSSETELSIHLHVEHTKVGPIERGALSPETRFCLQVESTQRGSVDGASLSFRSSLLRISKVYCSAQKRFA